MSYDFALEKPCSHQVLFETVTLDSVYQQTVRFQRPPFSQNITLYVNGAQVPQSGLYSVASLPFSNGGPYRIVSGQNDLLYFAINQNTPIFIPLNPGPTVSTSDLARDLGGKLPNLSVTVVNNRVVISTPAPVNGRAFLFPDPRWTDRTSSLPTTARILGAYQSLGIIPGRVASGYKLFPSWSLIRDPTSFVDSDRVIQFSEPLRNAVPIVQANYQTTAGQCRRCFGIRIEFDYNVLNGTYETVQNTDLLAQEFDKYLFTKIQSHWKWPWLGSNLINRIGGKGSTASSNVSALISMDVSQAFSTYQNIKTRQDSSFPFQQVTDAEFPATLTNVSVQSINGDPTSFFVTADIISRSRVPVPLTRMIGNPNPISVLSGDPTQVLQLASNPGFLLRG